MYDVTSTRSIFPCLQEIHDSFDWKFYFNLYPDLLEQGIITKDDIAHHWRRYGENEKRIPNLDKLKELHKHVKSQILQEQKNIEQRIFPLIEEDQVTFYILIRTSMRPELFDKCIHSVLSQSHKRIKVIVSYDNDKCLNYLDFYHDNRVSKMHVSVNSKNYYKFNLYSNLLLDSINTNEERGSWVIFLDDDDMLVHSNVLSYLNHIILEKKSLDYVFVWKSFQGSKITELTNTDPYFVKIGDVSSCTFCFHVSHAQKSRWVDQRGGDFHFFKGLVTHSCLQIDLLPYILTQTIDFHQPFFGHTSQDDIDMMKLSKLDNNILTRVWKNIDSITAIVSNFERILFLCGDYPGYGGAATNCSALHNFWSGREKKTYALYWNYTNEELSMKKYVFDERHMIVDEKDVENTLINRIPFCPDIIVLKSPCHVNLKKYFTCPVVYFVGGLYHVNLNKYYGEFEVAKDHDEFVNKGVLEQIKNSDISFCNSSHTQNILQEIYNLNTKLFYSTFVPFYKQTCATQNKQRKYKYGLIASDFSKPIKNVTESFRRIDAINTNSGVCVYVGKNSYLYKNNSVKETQFELIPYNSKTLFKIYDEIETLIQDSFFESCSNVKIEALFHGCAISSVFS